jgi:hypothetical protein
MNLITGITDSPSQVFTLPIQDGSSAVITLTYRPQQFGWFFNLVWNGLSQTFTLNSVRLTTFPNVLRQYRNQLPFGLWCAVIGNAEPTYQNDFLTGRATLYLLAPADVAAIESQVFA